MIKNTNQYDVIVVGAGPSGLNCAIRTAHAGLKTLVIDKADFPRDKICGDALSDKVIANLKTLPHPIYESFKKVKEKLPCYGIKFSAPNSTTLDIPYAITSNPDNAAGYVISRKIFDQFMIESAGNCKNLTLITGKKVTDVIHSDSKCQVITAHETYNSAILIGADGAHSLVAKKLTGSHYKFHSYFIGLRAYYENVTGFDTNNLEIYFTKELVPGYFWIFPQTNNIANVGLGISDRDYRKNPINLKKELERHISKDPVFRNRFSKSKLISNIRGEIIPQAPHKKTIAGKRYLLIGDAAGMADPLTAEGIGNAFVSGRLAAETIIRFFSINNPESYNLEVYENRIQSYLGKEFKLNYRLHQLIRHKKLFNFLFTRAKNNQSLIKLFSKMGDDLNARKALTKSSLYLKLLLGRKISDR